MGKRMARLGGLGLLFLVLGAACASPGPAGSPASSLPGDPQRYLLRPEDLPLGFRLLPQGSLDVPNQEVCRSQERGEAQECLKRLGEWGRLGGYQVQFQREEPLALLEGTFAVYNLAAVYKDAKGVGEALRYSRQALERASREDKGMALLEVPKVGDGAVAYLRRATESVNGREIAVSYYWLDFRRNNVLVRVGTVAPTALASQDDLLRYARLLDQRVLRGGQEVGSLGSAGSEAPLPGR